jgi:hypothetical protein
VPLLDPTAPQPSLAIANSAVLITLLDALVAKGIFDRSEVQRLVKDATSLVGARARTPEGSKAVDLLDALYDRFYEQS